MSIITWIKPTNKPSSNISSSGVNYDELWEFYPEFFDECSKIISGNYPEKSKLFINSILEFLEDWGNITWKQFHSVFKIHEKYEDFKKHLQEGTYCRKINNSEFLLSRGSVSFLSPYSSKIPSTDKELDSLYKVIFRESPRFYECEEEGLVLGYDKSGKRVFYLPTEDNILF